MLRNVGRAIAAVAGAAVREAAPALPPTAPRAARIGAAGPALRQYARPAGEGQGDVPAARPGTHPLAAKLAARYGPGGEQLDMAGSLPPSLASRPTATQKALFSEGSPVAQRFDALVAQAQAHGEPVRTVSLGIGRPGHDLVHMAVQLAQRGARSQVRGFDLHLPSIVHTREALQDLAGSVQATGALRANLDNIAVHRTDFARFVQKFPAEHGQLHAITCSATTPYMDDHTLDASLAAMMKALRPGGVAVLDGYGPEHQAAGQALHLRDVATLEAAAQRAGFELVKPGDTHTAHPFQVVTVHLVKPAAPGPARGSDR